MKKCLVLGAGGFIGKSLCKELTKKYKVVAYGRKQSKVLNSLSNLEFIEGDFVTEKNFCDILLGVDKVFHFISTTIPIDSTEKADEEVLENVIPTIRLLEAMQKSGTKEIIFASSGGTIYGETQEHRNQVTDFLNPICSYGVQKKVIESYLQFYHVRHGICHKIIRISNPYGIGQAVEKPQGVIPIFIRNIFRGEKISVFGDGENFRDYIYLEDLVSAIIKVAEYEGKEHIFNIGTGKVYSLKEIIHFIETITNKKFCKIEYKPNRICDVHKSLLEVDSTYKELNWKPSVSIEDGIQKICNYYQSYLEEI